MNTHPFQPLSIEGVITAIELGRIAKKFGMSANDASWPKLIDDAARHDQPAVILEGWLDQWHSDMECREADYRQAWGRRYN